MNSYLQNALTKYYCKNNSCFIFKNGMTLNKLALEMWGRLGCKQIDAGVLSKVLKGKRLFTPLQLEIFCSILKISKDDRQYLHHCLYLDHCGRFGVDLGQSFFSDNNMIHFCETIMDRAENLLYLGKCNELVVLSTIINEQIKTYLKNNSLKEVERDKLSSFLAKCLYLKGRAIGSISTPSQVIKKILPVTESIEELGKDRDILAYVNTLLSNAYYVVGNYSNALKSDYFYRESASYAKKSIEFFNDGNKEKLFSIRTLVASAGYLRDRSMFEYARKEAEETLKVTSEDNFVNALHLYGTLAKTMALLGYKNPMKIKEIPRNFFNKTLIDKGIYEVSDIRNELELYSILNIKDESYVKLLSKRGLKMASKYKYFRHSRSIRRIANNLLK
jgi:hypothetical protein